MSTCFVLFNRVYPDNRYKQIPNTIYLATTDGKIFNAKTGKEILPIHHYKGYKQIKFGRKNYYIHRLVCTAYHGEPFVGAEVDHIDGIRDNNRPNNLRWVTPEENRRSASSRFFTTKAPIIDGVPF